MFNRSSFDRTLYDRRSDFDSVEAALRGSSSLKLEPTVKIFFEAFALSGSGGAFAGATLRQNVQAAFDGAGAFEVSDFRLRLRLAPRMAGAGSLLPNVGAKTPIGLVNFGGSGDLADSAMYALQHVEGRLPGAGGMNTLMTVKWLMESIMAGRGGLEDRNLMFLLPLANSLGGSGQIAPFRIGALNTDALELDNLNLRPGQTLLIDTDELNVFIDDILNVDVVTGDSVFFQLQPGENEITFFSKGGAKLTVTVVWQNRWL